MCKDESHHILVANSFTMTDLRIAFRNLLKYRRYTIPNILGLSVAIGALIVILQFLSFELSFDGFYENRLCRLVNTRYQEGDQVQRSTVSYSAVGPALVQDLPEVINQSRLFPFGNAIVRAGGNQDAATIRRCVAVEPSFLDMFGYELLAGDKQTALTKPNQLVLTETTAISIFGTSSWSELIGAVVKLDNDPDSYEIVGIIKDLPENTHLSYNLFLSYETIIHTWGLSQARFDWNMLDFRHYVQVREDVSVDQLNAKMQAFSDQYFDNNDSNTEVFELQPIEDIYLSNDAIEYDIAVQGDPQLVTTLLSLAIILFVISWINFINLNGALLLRRRQSMGIRKVLGISSQQVWRGHALEICMVVLLTVITGFILALEATSLLQSNGFHLKNLAELLHGGYLHYPLMSGLLALLGACTMATIALSVRFNLRLRPSKAPGGAGDSAGLGFPLYQRALLVFQFVLSIMAFSTGSVIYLQQQHVLSSPLGLELNNRWVLQQPKLTPSDSTFSLKLASFKQSMSSIPGIHDVATNQRTPGQQLQADYDASIDGQRQTLSYLVVDEDYLTFYGIPLLAGRAFRASDVKRNLIDTRFVIINERVLQSFGIEDPGDAIGKRLTIQGSTKEIIGVVADFRQQSLQYSIQPTVLMPSIHANHQIVIRSQASPTQWLSQAKEAYLAAFPGNSLEYRNLEDEYIEHYQSIADANRAFGLFTLLSMLVAIFGMMALASLNLIARLKEISIRKILGASEGRLFAHMLRKYAVDMGMAACIGAPFAFHYSALWLDQYQSHIPWSPLHIIVPVVSMAATAFAILFLVAYRSLRRNPTEVLRME